MSRNHDESGGGRGKESEGYILSSGTVPQKNTATWQRTDRVLKCIQTKHKIGKQSSKQQWHSYGCLFFHLSSSTRMSTIVLDWRERKSTRRLTPRILEWRSMKSDVCISPNRTVPQKIQRRAANVKSPKNHRKKRERCKTEITLVRLFILTRRGEY